MNTFMDGYRAIVL